jgi:hypothetical protein
MDHDWTQFKLRINIDHTSIKEVYDCWATQHGLEKWFLRLAEFRSQNGNFRHSGEQLKKGDSYKWLWHGWNDEMEGIGAILHANGKDQFSFSFEGCEVYVKIYTEENCTICELVQSKIASDASGTPSTYLGCSSGWSFFLCNLKSILEGGIDLRNKNENLTNLINA